MSLTAVDAIRRYVFGFVNSHDFSVCRELMSDDYTLHMGDSEVVGREAAYIPAVQHQIDQFPDMGMTVHDVITDGDHVVLHFSEHGRTRDGLVAAWPGVSIYRFDGTHLVECWVEQDHYSRRMQLAERRASPTSAGVDRALFRPRVPARRRSRRGGATMAQRHQPLAASGSRT